MNYREMVGQRLVVGLKGTEVDSDLEALIRDYKIGNVILFKENIKNNHQVKQLCQDIQDLVMKHTGKKPFITVDQEGGMVTRLEKDAVNIPGAMAISATNNPDNAYIAGKITGLQLKELGFNVDLAPVADINSNIHNPVIGVRSYGDNEKVVSTYVTQMSKGLEETGVLSVAKHFPGHGDTNVDSHFGLPEINKSLNDLYNCELIPFIELIKSGISGVMTTHILFPQIEPENVPATMSRRIITDLLKNQLGFKGLVMSDCMEMQAIQKFYGTVNGVRKAVQAGVDLIFITHTPHLAKEASDDLVQALENKELDLAEFEESLTKIALFKEKVEKVSLSKQEFDYSKNSEIAMDLLKKSITAVNFPAEKLPELGNTPLFVGCKPFRATNILNVSEGELNFADYMAKAFNAKGITINHDPKDDEIKDYFKDGLEYSTVVIGSYNAHLYEGQRKIIEYLAEKVEKVILIALRNPYDLMDLPKNVYGIAAYEYTYKNLQAIEQVLKHDWVMTGKLPVKLK